MSATTVAFVTTTINRPEFLEGYIENIQSHGHQDAAVEFVVVGDIKTPTTVRDYCRSLSERHEFPVRYESVDDQAEWLSEHGLDEVQSYLPHNSIQRRNVGYLQAYERGADVIVSLDDDNLAGEDDILAAFETVGETHDVLEVSSSNGWYNCASMLDYESEDSRDVYHRGFPYSKRDDQTEYEFTRTERRVMIRAGLWSDVPDIDVVTHLERNPRATGLRDEFTDELVALADGTSCPVNTQNTAFHADLMPLVHTIPMGHEVLGMDVDRFDDIWLGFFAEKILDGVGGTVAYGTPLSIHDRNTHDLERELEHEAIGIRLNEVVVEILDEIEIESDSYDAGYRELVEKFRERLDNDYDYQFEAYFHTVLDGMETWADACSRLR